MDFKDFVNPFGVALELFRGHFGATLRTLESIWTYEGGFGALWNHFATTLKSLWVCERPFSKNTSAQ